LDVARAFQVTRIKVECCRDEHFAKARRVNPNKFFAELKRRHVYKIAIAYAIVGWLLIQVATQAFPFLEIPNWAIRLVIMLIVLGFPIALILAWAFEITPEGIKRTEVADRMPSAPGQKKHVWVYVGHEAREEKVETSLPTLRKSIAVLPFENLSEDKANAYFADGIQEEILTRLSRIGDLKVISRTSTQRFKNSPEDISHIAKQLGVANILEGTVRKAGDQVRVHVQLIDAESDSYLWAERYDRKLTDIFAVESDIAAKIADALQAKLTGAERRAISSQGSVIILRPGLPSLKLLSKPRHDCGQMLVKRIWRARNIFIMAGATTPARWQSWRARTELYRMMRVSSN
jgi:TolB-like protein